ncbi:hypothetical protein [Salinactinospora qingdaonensis]|uniref:Uncharacterized protein n=1 Tax=Salinactinospora qingdaonensis TaxID=702744 RepID=A0ABP7GAE2_9ACTN
MNLGHDRRFDVELSLPQRPLRGVTEFPETRTDRFAPLIAWARSWANYLNTPVGWRVSHNGTTFDEGVAHPCPHRGYCSC